ncbi:transcription repressor OFP13-like [Typha angustifolia]|uniref:transcription repressor OFP13-like n=1 Tax=Typha angustifolia TaxID=59011 RepID=UPI003C300A67
MEAIALPGGHITSQRFFFSSHTTRDIMEESKSKPSLLKRDPFPGNEEDEEEEEHVAELSFSDESMKMVMASNDPYQDFRASMEEMVEMHELNDWPRLLELLHCYLKLNEKKTHKVIMLAFMDLLAHLMDRDKEFFSASFPLTSYLIKSPDQ